MPAEKFEPEGKKETFFQRLLRHAPPLSPPALRASPAWRYLHDQSLDDLLLVVGAAQPPDCLLASRLGQPVAAQPMAAQPGADQPSGAPSGQPVGALPAAAGPAGGQPGAHEAGGGGAAGAAAPAAADVCMGEAEEGAGGGGPEAMDVEAPAGAAAAAATAAANATAAGPGAAEGAGAPEGGAQQEGAGAMEGGTQQQQEGAAPQAAEPLSGADAALCASLHRHLFHWVARSVDPERAILSVCLRATKCEEQQAAEVRRWGGNCFVNCHCFGMVDAKEQQVRRRGWRGWFGGCRGVGAAVKLCCCRSAAAEGLGRGVRELAAVCERASIAPPRRASACAGHTVRGPAAHNTTHQCCAQRRWSLWSQRCCRTWCTTRGAS